LPASSEVRGLLSPLAAVAREAGAVALRTFRASTLKSWTKDGSSPVSEADLAVDALLRERLAALAPDAAWLSEETEDNAERQSARRVWIVDPIDGTRAYIAGLPDWTVSIALVDSGRPALAALYAPASDEMFLAATGQGVERNGQPIAATLGDAIADARFAGPKRYLDWITKVSTQARPVAKIHSLALRLARVAQGEVDAAFTAGNSHDWDLAAADLLVHEAGGLLTDIQGRQLVYNAANPVHGTLIAAGKTRHAALVELARQRDTAL
jgi:myo-inositol-1(or 4)-monophosphatase